MHRARGLSLLEVLISIGLIVMLLATMFGFYELALKDRDRGRRTMDHGEKAWLTLFKIAEDIRAANGFVATLGPGIQGYRQQITLQTVTIPDKEVFATRSVRDKPLPAQSDVREVRYYVGLDPDQIVDYKDPESESGVKQGPNTLGIVRRQLKTFRQTALQNGQVEDYDVELLAPELKYLRFRYFDGVEWTDVWQPQGGGMGNSLPQAVEVTVGFQAVAPEDPNEIDFDTADRLVSQPEPYDPDRYSVVVRLNQADTFFGSRMMRASRRAFSGSGSGSGGSPGSGSGGSGNSAFGGS